MQRSITFRDDCAMKESVLLIAIAASGVSACTTPQEIPGCRQYDCVALGELQRIGHGIAARPIEVTEDSRCPIEADCVWEGRVLVETQLELGHEVITVALDTSAPLRINKGMLSIAEVAPEMSVEWSPIPPDSYRFAFSFVPDIMDEDPAENSAQ